MELMEAASQLMPNGRPQFTSVVKYPKIETLISEFGKAKIATVIFLLLKDFCNSLNVVRNMNEDQIIEGSAMLLDECGNFRLQDYVMMFSLAKKGELVKIYDRIDLQVLTSIMDAYWLRRHKEGEAEQERGLLHFETMGPVNKQIENVHPMEAKAIQAGEKLAGQFEAWKQIVKDV